LRCPPSFPLLAAGFALGAATAPAAAAPFAEVARIGGLHDLGRIAPAQHLELAILLAYRHAPELEQLVRAQSDSASPLYHRYLRADQFTNYFAPAASDLARVVVSLRSAGFTVTKVYPNRTIVDATAPAAVAARYFGTDIHSVTQVGYGERYVNVTPASAPSSVRDVLAGVVGLSNIRYIHKELARAPGVRPALGGGNIFGPDGGYGPAAFLGAYDMPGKHGVDGKGQKAGIVIDADYLTTDLAAYLTYFNVPRSAATPTKRVLIDGGPPAGLTADSDETTLDIETIASLAPQAAIYVYEFPSFEKDSYIIDAYERVISDDVVATANSSFGGCEDLSTDSFPQETDALALQGAALGITFHASSGDSGSYGGCASTGVSAPASGPHFVAVGGTELFLKPTSGAVEREFAWGDFTGASGGGFSAIFDLPAYQKGVKGVITMGRNVPDVSFDASPLTGESFFYGGLFQGPIGGTSLSSPIFGAALTGINELEGARNGFVNPRIYAAFKKYGYASGGKAYFRDITYGSNGFYQAKAGYDQVTGIGAPNVLDLAPVVK
jgi:subtilase family serine protease